MNGTYNTHYDVSLLTFWGERQEGEESTPRLVVALRDGKPRFKAYLGKGKGIIDYGCDPMTFGLLIRSLKRVAKGEFGVKETHPSVKNKWVDNKPTNERIPGPIIIFGRSKEGIVYIALKDPVKGTLAFQMQKSEWHEHYGINQEPLSVSELSSDMALYFTDILTQISAEYIVEYTKDAYEHGEFKPLVIEPYDPNKPRSGKFNNKPKQPPATTEAGSVSVDDFDDDIPF